MVVRTCPMCRGLGHFELPAPRKAAPYILKIDVQAILADLRGGMSNSQVGKKYKISKGTIWKIGNGTWAGFRKT